MNSPPELNWEQLCAFFEWMKNRRNFYAAIYYEHDKSMVLDGDVTEKDFNEWMRDYRLISADH